MRIAWLEPPSAVVQGDQVHRTRAPLEQMAQQHEALLAIDGAYLEPRLQRAAIAADVLVLCQAVEADFVPLLRRRAQAGRLNVVEINDHFRRPVTEAAGARAFCSPIAQALFLQLAGLADGVQYSTAALQRLFATPNKPQAVFANTAPLQEAQRVGALGRRPAGHKVRIGWGGSLGHRQDVLWALPAIAQALKEHPQCTFEAMAPPQFAPLFAGLDPAQFRLRPAGDFLQYLAFVAGLDIALAPQQDTPFNRGRSDVKFLEAAACRVAFIGSRLPAYTEHVVDGETGVLFGSPAELLAALRALIAAPERRGALAEAAHRYACEQRAPADTARRRLAFFFECLRARKGLRGDAAAFDACLPAVAFKHARVFHVPLGEQSQRLLLALRAHAEQPAAATVAPLLADAARGQPPTALCRLWQAALAAPNRQSVARLDALVPHWPDSHALALARVRHRVAIGDRQGARRLAAQLCEGGGQECAALWLLQAELTEPHDRDAAVPLWRRAWALQPALWPAAVRLIGALASSAKSEAHQEAIDIAEAAWRASHEQPDFAVALAQTWVRAEAWPQALQALSRWHALVETSAVGGAQQAQGWALWAQALAKSGQPKRARQCVARAHALLASAPAAP